MSSKIRAYKLTNCPSFICYYLITEDLSAKTDEQYADNGNMSSVKKALIYHLSLLIG